jgi:hypothetical protein
MHIAEPQHAQFREHNRVRETSQTYLKF